MIGNLIIFSTEENIEYLQLDLTTEIYKIMNYNAVDISDTTVFSGLYFMPDKFANLLRECTIILVDFDNLNCLEIIKKVLLNRYNSELQNTEFGFMLMRENESCFVLNADNENLIDKFNQATQVMFNRNVITNIKMFGLEKPNILKALATIPEFSNFICTVYAEHLDANLCIRPIYKDERMTQQFLRHIYEGLRQYIYADEPVSLLQSLSDLLHVRNRKIAVVDYLTGGFINKTLSNMENSLNYIRENIVIQQESDFIELLNINPQFIAENDSKNVNFGYEVATVLLKTSSAHIIAVLGGTITNPYIAIGDDCAVHLYKFNFNHRKEYIYKLITNITIHKILKKLSENTLTLYDNNV